MAANRTFPHSVANEIPPEYLNTYFIAQRNGFSVAKEIREMIVFSAHNIIQDPPFGKIDFVSCRNFLIYLKPPIQQRLFAMFQYVLRKDGVLFLGSSESLGEMQSEFLELDKKYKIFVNKESKKLLQLRSEKDRLTGESSKMPARYERTNPIEQTQKYDSNSSQRRILQIQDYLIREFVPDTIVFTEEFELVHTTGTVNRWLKLPLGEVSTNVLRMLPESLSLTFELMANKTRQSAEPVKLKNVKVEGDMVLVYGSDKMLNITINQLNSPEEKKKCWQPDFRLQNNPTQGIRELK